MREIPLTKGYVAMVDDEDYEHLSRFNWYAHKGKKTWYARRDFGGKKRKKRVYMHREIAGETNPSKKVDHKDGNGLNNQKSNLRLATDSQSSTNTRVGRRKNNTSGFRGVTKHQTTPDTWVAQIAIEGNHVYLGGNFKTKEAAAKAYDEAAKKYHKEFAVLNFT